MRYLSLDVGTRRTGIAYLDTDVGIPLPLDTIKHLTEEQLIEDVLKIVGERTIDHVIVGLPLLLSGAEGEQAAYSRHVGELLSSRGVRVRYRYERQTTPRQIHHKNALPTKGIDGDSVAACAILSQKTDI